MDKIYVIIGASSGIGYETSKKLIGGNKLVLGSRNIKDVENALTIRIDITKEKSIENFFNTISKHHDHIDGLVNCAGYIYIGDVRGTSLDEWKKVFDVNLAGVFTTIKYALKLMHKGGRIINIASTSGINPRSGWVAYSVAKSGLISLSSVLAEELNPLGIKLFTLCPGRTATPLRRLIMPDEDQSTIMQPEKVAEIISMCIDGRLDVLSNQILKISERI